MTAIKAGAVTRYRNDWGVMVPDKAGQWVHVQDLDIETWKLDIPLPARKSAARVTEPRPGEKQEGLESA